MPKLRGFLDIRSGSVGGAIVRVFGNSKPDEILFSSRKSFQIMAEFKGERLLSSALEATREILTLMMQSTSLHPDEIHIVIGSPWFFSQTRTINHSGQTLTKCARSWADSVIAVEQKQFIETNFKDRKPVLVEKYLIRASLNGYPTNKPFGKNAFDQELVFYLSAIEESTALAMKRAVMNIFGTRTILWHTLPLMALFGVDEVVPTDLSSYLVVDIGGEVSEFFMVRDKLIASTFSVPLGAHSVIRKIAQDLRTPLDVARTLYENHTSGSITSKLEQKVARSVSSVELKWSSYVSDILRKVSGEYIMPGTVVVVGGSSTGLLFKRVLESADIAALFPQHAPPKIILPQPEDFKLKYAGKLKDSKKDIFLNLEISSLDKIREFEYA